VRMYVRKKNDSKKIICFLFAFSCAVFVFFKIFLQLYQNSIIKRN
jgi:hypothetical protein